MVTIFIASAKVKFPVCVVAAIFVTVSVATENVKSASSVNRPFVVAKGTRPDVPSVSQSVMFFRAAPVVIVAKKSSVVNSTAPASAVVSEVPDVNLTVRPPPPLPLPPKQLSLKLPKHYHQPVWE